MTWLTEERRQLLVKSTAATRPLLVQAGLWRATLSYWVRWQASLEANWSEEEETEAMERAIQQWQNKHQESSSPTTALNQPALRAKLRVAPAVAHWSRAQWGHRLESVYLKVKSDLDQASCRLLRISDKAMASELYYRVKAGETTFEKAAYDFGEGPERWQGGLIPLQTLRTLPYGLAPLLERLEPGRISSPLRLGKVFCLVELVELRMSQLDEQTETTLLAEQLRLWIDSVVDVLEADLLWPGEPSTTENS